MAEPQVNLRLPEELRVLRGGRPVAAFGKPLYDYTTIANLLQPVAAYAAACDCPPLLHRVDRTSAESAPGTGGRQSHPGAMFAEQASNALAALHDAGYESESLLHASHFAVEAMPGLAVTYANAYARARVSDNLCGFSFATCKAGKPDYVMPSPLLTLFGTGSGIPPTPLNGIQLVFNDADGGAVDHRSANGDFALAG